LERERNCSRFFGLHDFRSFTRQSAAIPDLKVRIAQFLLLTNAEKQQALVVLLRPVLLYFSHD